MVFCYFDAISAAPTTLDRREDYMSGEIAEDRGKRSLTLPLFMPLVRADHAQHAFAPYDLAVRTDLSYRASYFHL